MKTNQAMTQTNEAEPAQKPNYRIYDRTGGGVTEDIHAESLDDAIEQGRAWIENGDWIDCDGDDDGADGRTYRTIELECSVHEIAFRVPRAELDGDEESRVRDLLKLECAPESIRGVSYSDMDRGQLSTLADYLGGDDPSVSEEDQEFDSSIADQIREALEDEDEDITDDNNEHDCSGRHTPGMPECEQAEHASDDETTDDEGHAWRQPYSVVGGCKENPGVWSGGGTRMNYHSVCRLCGCHRHTTDPGSQRNPDEALETITIKDRDEGSALWLQRTHEEDGWLPAWLAEMLDIPPRESPGTDAGDV